VIKTRWVVLGASAAGVVAVGLSAAILASRLAGPSTTSGYPTPPLVGATVTPPPTTSPTTPTASTQPTPSSTPASPCQAAQLSLSLDQAFAPNSNEDAAAYLALTNVSSGACSLDGYPLVSAYGPSGQMIDIYADHGGTYGNAEVVDPGIGLVTLAPGSVAYFGAIWNSWPGTGCTPMSRLSVGSPVIGGSIAAPIEVPELCGPGGSPPPLWVTAIADKQAFTASPDQP